MPVVFAADYQEMKMSDEKEGNEKQPNEQPTPNKGDEQEKQAQPGEEKQGE